MRYYTDNRNGNFMPLSPQSVNIMYGMLLDRSARNAKHVALWLFDFQYFVLSRKRTLISGRRCPTINDVRNSNSTPVARDNKQHITGREHTSRPTRSHRHHGFGGVFPMSVCLLDGLSSHLRHKFFLSFLFVLCSEKLLLYVRQTIGRRDGNVQSRNLFQYANSTKERARGRLRWFHHHQFCVCVSCTCARTFDHLQTYKQHTHNRYNNICSFAYLCATLYNERKLHTALAFAGEMLYAMMRFTSVYICVRGAMCSFLILAICLLVFVEFERSQHICL